MIDQRGFCRFAPRIPARASLPPRVFSSALRQQAFYIEGRLAVGILPAELRDRLFDVLQAQLSGFSILGVGRLDQSSVPDADVGSDAASDVPTMEGGRYTCTGATDSETGLSAAGTAESAACVSAMKQSDPEATAVASKLPRTLRARRVLPLREPDGGCDVNVQAKAKRSVK